MEHIPELLNLFKEQGVDTAHVHFGHVKDINDTCDGLSETCLSTQDYAITSRQLTKILENNAIEHDPIYPKKTKGIYCSANALNNMIIGPEGMIYKCWNDIGFEERSIGHLMEPTTPKQAAFDHKYVLYSPFDDKECIECNVLPICMGGCPADQVISGKKSCDRWLYEMEENMLESYERMTKQ